MVLATKRNAGSFTYDGIECGGERVAKEIEETLEDLGREGHKIKKLSMVGYSLGGLVARYAIGLLQSRGLFDQIQPVNFTTFATPHLGVRTPLKGYWSHIWNVLGARTLSMSGRQLFMIDTFRDTGRPLLSVLADSNSIFTQALSMFERRSLYSNIVNDKSAPHYTTAISRTDPFVELDKVDVNFATGYDPIILDAKDSVRIKDDKHLPSFYSRLAGGSQTFLSRFPLYFVLLIFIPIGSVVFLINSAIQTGRSKRRIRLHENDSLGFRGYRVPLMVQNVRQAVEDVFENVNAAQGLQYLPIGSEELTNGADTDQRSSSDTLPDSLRNQPTTQGSDSEKSSSDLATLTDKATLHPDQFPTLALTSAQFAMVKSLDDIGFRKHYVWIHQSRHSHAAIIVRINKESFAEGKVVIKHWLQEEFKI